MAQYIARRLVLTLVTIWLITLIVFGSIRIVPGQAVDLLLHNTGGGATPEERQALEEDLGLDRPLVVQYGSWMGGVLQGDFGRSLWNDQPIFPQIKRFLPVTLELGLMSVVMAAILGITLGVLGAVSRGRWLDVAARVLGILMLSLPGYWVATMVIAYGAVYFSWTPPLRYTAFADDPLGNLNQFWLPAALMALATTGVILRFTRTAMLEVLAQDYVKVARSKGIRGSVVIWRHALRNGMIPVVSLIGVYIGYALSSTVLFEQIFGLPGIGRYLLQSINSRDYPAVQALTLLLAVFVSLVNLAVDISYGYIDPRLRVSR